jgi:hypothetical protein
MVPRVQDYEQPDQRAQMHGREVGARVRKVSSHNNPHICANFWLFNRLYYQYQEDRLPTCPLTIHALLHLPDYIRRAGPLWASWAFVMERFCGHLLVPAVKNRIRPYENLDNYVQQCAQMQIVVRVFDMPSLARPRVDYRYQAGERLTSHEFMYDDCELFNRYRFYVHIC